MSRSPHDPAPPCFVCDLPAWSGKTVYGPSPSKDRRLCGSCERQGFSMELGEAPGRGTITTPEGITVEFNLSHRNPPGKVGLKRLRDKDTPKIPGTENLFIGPAQLK